MHLLRPTPSLVVKALRLYDDDVRQCFIECTTQTMVGNRPNLVQVEVDLDCIAYRTTLQQHILLPSQPLTVVPTLITIFYNLYNTTFPLFHWLRLFQWKQFWLELLDHQKDLPSKLENHQFRLLFQSLSLPNRARLLSASSSHAAAWLQVAPAPGLNLHLSRSMSFQDTC